jgi:hypothetical protein
MKKAHAKFSASGSHRWINCPASIAACENYENVDSAAAQEGTRAHHCLETFMLAFIAGKRGKELKALYQFLLNDHPEEMVRHAFEAHQKIVTLTPRDALLIAETKVDASHFTCPDQFGTVDAAIVEEFVQLHVIDFKYGIGIPVMPEENTQAIYYALGIAKRFHFNFEHVHLTIIQPRDGHERGAIRTWSITMQELLNYVPMFREAVKKCEDPLAEFKAGEWCFFCPAKNDCATHTAYAREHALLKAQSDFDD